MRGSSSADQVREMGSAGKEGREVTLFPPEKGISCAFICDLRWPDPSRFKGRSPRSNALCGSCLHPSGRHKGG
jgi:hypothetical protein